MQEIQGIKLNNLGIETPLLHGKIEYKASVYPQFGEALGLAMENLNDVHLEAKSKVEDFASGKNINVSDVMVTLEKASLALDLSVQVRNRLLDAYNELNRMQV
jgi:flagellar hook-basal body complex protein FliE